MMKKLAVASCGHRRSYWSKTGETQLVSLRIVKSYLKKREMLAEIEAALPEVTSIMQNVNQAKSSLIFGDETFLLAGKESIEEKLMELEFDLSRVPFSN